MMKLSDMIQREFNLAGFCENTRKNYSISISAGKKYFKKSFIEITEDDLKNYFSELVEAKKSQSTIKNHYYALSFLFKRVLERDFPLSRCPVGKAEKKLPTVLASEEIKAIIDATTTTKQKAILSVAYSGGLRISEISNLKICDIDSKRMMIKISQGKGRKDRYTILSKITRNHLREYFIQYHPKTWLFYGKDKESKFSIRCIQYFYSKIKKKLGLRKEVIFHTLRHSFATHSYEGGTGLLHIQRLMGHASIKTTMVYTHLASMDAAKIKSPLDSLYE